MSVTLNHKELTLDIDGVKSISLVIAEDGSVGSITSSLKDSCPYCQLPDCYADCDGSQGDIDELESEEDMENRRRWNETMDVIESLVLGHACAGVDVTSKAYITGIQTTIEALTNNM